MRDYEPHNTNNSFLRPPPKSYWLLVSLSVSGSQLAVSWDILSTQGFACSRLVDANYHTGLIVVSGVYYASLLAVLLNIVIVDDTKVDVDG